MSPKIFIKISYNFESFCFAAEWWQKVSFHISTCGWGIGHKNLILTNQELLEILRQLGG
jgi:hypothetical protein